MISLAAPVLSVSGVLFGFLFTGFWWALNRELQFQAGERHFKPGYLLLILGTALVGYYGILVPLRGLAATDCSLMPSYRGVFLALVGIVGYMLTEFGHYSVYRRPKYWTPSEAVFFGITVTALLVLAFIWRAHILL